jgi:hypothetical protein
MKELHTAKEVREHWLEVQKRILSRFDIKPVEKVEEIKKKAPPPIKLPQFMPPRHSIRIITDRVLSFYAVTRQDFYNTSIHLPKVVTARHVVFYISHKLGYSSSMIGKMCNCDHATVLHGTELIRRHIIKGDAVVELINYIGADIAENIFKISWSQVKKIAP